MISAVSNNTTNGDNTGLSSLEPISIQDLESGNLDLDAIILDVKTLQEKIENIRYQMYMYISLMASMDECSTPIDIYNEISNKITTLQTEFNTFFTSYKRIAPIIRYIKIKQSMNPDDSIKVIPHRVPVDMKLLNDKVDQNFINQNASINGSPINTATNTATIVGVVNGNSAVSTPVTASSINTPTGKKATKQTQKRKTTKKTN